MNKPNNNEKWLLKSIASKLIRKVKLFSCRYFRNISDKTMLDMYWDSLVVFETEGSFTSKKICVFAHFDTSNIIQDYVLFYLKALRKEGVDIVFVTTSENMESSELLKINNIVSKSIIRKNIGYDFGSWRTGFQRIEGLDSIELLILANDSVVGPVADIKNMFENMSRSKMDVWGVTDNYEIDYHVQSYFICFTRKVLKNGFVKRFFSRVKILDTKQDIINEYEVGLSQQAITEGYSVGAYCSYEEIEQHVIGHGEQKDLYLKRKVNSTLWFPYVLLSKFDCPFIKIELLRDNPNKIELDNSLKLLKANLTYPFEYVSNHQKSGVTE